MAEEAAFEPVGARSDGAAERPWVVLKFGGSSVATLANWQKIQQRIRSRREEGYRVLVVHSALRGISDLLQAMLDRSAAGDDSQELLAQVISSHDVLARDFELDAGSILDDYLSELRQLIAGVRLVREITPRVAARVMALGELMATALSVAWLSAQGLAVRWQDARKLLRADAVPAGEHAERRAFLNATCTPQPDALVKSALSEDCVHLTQGFIASNDEDETVLLGRGGSDTSAAYLAAMLSAARLEIWTDVPGMFSADPRVVPAARLLKRLHYSEAQEIASTGGLVLHPRCIGPLREQHIPLYVRCTPRPELPGTLIGDIQSGPEPTVKAISLRQNVTLLSLEGVVMWQEVGFLARVFNVFAEHGVSIDLVSTSESNVTVSIDQHGEPLTDNHLQAVVDTLKRLCRVTVIRNCAAVSLVGRKIRTILHRVGPAMAVFEEHRIHLVSQAANDLNLSFVVDDAQGFRLVQQLHPMIIRRGNDDDSIGDTWQSLQLQDSARPAPPASWWRGRRDTLLQLMETRDHCYVYDAATIQARIDALRSIKSIDTVLFAMKANSNPTILRQVYASGLGFECVSPGELDRIFALFPEIDPARILYTPNFAPRDDYAAGFARGVQVTLDNLYPLKNWPDLFVERDIFVRLDPGKGRGHHEHVKTAGVHSKFGVPLFELDALQSLAEAAGCRITGIHAHSGSGITQADSWRQVAEILVDAARRFPDVRVLDLGGGLGVPEKPGDDLLDLQAFNASLAPLREQFPDIQFWLEPGRFLVAEAGALLARVTQTKGKGEVRYVGIGTGMNSLIRPALYGAYHEIVNLTRIAQVPDQIVTVVGPICETGDTLGSERLMPAAEGGDVLLIANAGAYGYVMASHYNLRSPAEELVIAVDGGVTRSAQA